MSITLELTPTEEQRLQHLAAREGVQVTEYARRHLLSSDAGRNVRKKPLRPGEFLKPVSERRSAEEIDATLAEIDRMREEWDDKEQEMRREIEHTNSRDAS